MIIIHEPNKITQPYFGDPSNRWLDGLSNSEHHALPAISSSAIKYFHKNSPWAFYKKYVLKEAKPSEFKPEFKTGTLIHLALLEPEKFEKTVVVCDETVTTNKFKEFREKFLDSVKPKISLVSPILPIIEDKNEPECPDSIESEVDKESERMSQEVKKAKKERVKRARKSGDRDLIQAYKDVVLDEDVVNKPKLVLPNIAEYVGSDLIKPEPITVSKNGGYIVGDEEYYIIKSSEMRMLREIQNNAKEHTRFELFLRGCEHIEQSGIARCPRTGLYLSCRGDARSDRGYFLDPKSIQDISMHNMAAAQANFSYFLQHSHYLYVANLIESGKYDRFYFLYISKTSPYELYLGHLKPEDVAKSNEIYHKILNKIAECESKQKWPTADNGNGGYIDIPPWAFR
jgi:hypothetical protein